MLGPYPYQLREIPPYPGGYITISWGTKTITRHAIIDTGASHTAIPDWIVGQLRLRQISDELPVDVFGPEVPTNQQNLYAANLVFLELPFDSHPVVSVPWPEVLIGRDIINKWVLRLDGPNRRFTIED